MSADPSLADYLSLRYSAGGHFVTRHVSQYLGAACAWAAQNLGLAPSHITLLGTATFLGGAWAFARLPDSAASAVICLMLFQLGYALDCADGQLARALGRTSAFGAWLDKACDCMRNASLACALALWAGWHGAAALGIAGAVLFVSGTGVLLHTVTTLQGGSATPATPRGALREFVTAMLDTPTVLLMFAVLRPFPALLGAFATAIGLAYLGVSFQLARKRL